MLEIEAKFRVASHEPVRKSLRTLGAAFLGRVLESNRILDRPDGSLRRLGRGLRIRSTVADDGGKTTAALTLKGPLRAGAFKAREELEIEISSPETAGNILRILGFVPILTYQKRRESWSHGECRIELDEPPHIGLFVEIEGPSESAIRSVQSDLGLDRVGHTSESYVRMLLNYCAEHRLTDRVLDLPEPPPCGTGF